MMGEKEIVFRPFAYQCPLCCYIMEMPCFKDKKCPECGCDKPDILYIKVEAEEK